MTETRTSCETISEQMEKARERMEEKRRLAAQCRAYYPVLQGRHEQVAAAETIQGAVTIKETFERRFPSEDYTIGPRTLVMSDALIRLEFAPTEMERLIRAREDAKLAQAQQAMNQLDNPSPEYIKSMLEGIDG